MLYWPSDTVSPVRLYRRIYYYITHTHTHTHTKKKKASEPWRICAYRCRHPRVPSVQGRVPGAPPLPSILNIVFICRRFYSQGLFAKKKNEEEHYTAGAEAPVCDRIEIHFSAAFHSYYARIHYVSGKKWDSAPFVRTLYTQQSLGVWESLCVTHGRRAGNIVLHRSLSTNNQWICSRHLTL